MRRMKDVVRTEKLRIDQTEESTQAALAQADAFIRETGLAGKKAIHLRLLVEEMLGMVRAMTGDFDASFWLESEDTVWRVCLSARTDMSLEKKTGLLSVSKSGKNAATKGFMGKIGEIIEDCLLNFDDVMTIKDDRSAAAGYNYMSLDMPGDFSRGVAPMSKEQLVWSLNHYRSALEEAPDSDAPSESAWDELEKSIVANIASDVIVGVKKDHVDMTIVMS